MPWSVVADAHPCIRGIPQAPPGIGTSARRIVTDATERRAGNRCAIPTTTSTTAIIKPFSELSKEDVSVSVDALDRTRRLVAAAERRVLLEGAREREGID